MTKNNAVVAIYKSHTEAEAAVQELQHSGFDMKKLSIVGRDQHTDEHVTGFRKAFAGRAGLNLKQIKGVQYAHSTQ